jgi:acetyltransferase-like isoleucine patch superfamily enzyme
VWIGTKVTVARGVVIGEGAVVGANAVVTHDLPPYSVSVGVPARVIKDRRTIS